MTILARFFGGSVTILAGIMLGKLLVMVNNIILARCLTPYDFGILLLGLSILEVISIPTYLGLPSVLPGFVAEYRELNDPHKIQRFVSLSLGLCLGCCLLVSVAVYPLSSLMAIRVFDEASLQPVIQVFALVLPFYVMTHVLMSVCRGYQLTWPKLFFQDVFPAALRILLFLVLFAMGFQLGAAYTAFAVTYVAIFIWAFLWLKKRVVPGLWLRLNDKALRRKLLSRSWPLSLQTVVWVIYSQIDRLCIAYFLSPDQVGVYGAAFSITALINIIPQAFSYLSLPIFARFTTTELLGDLHKFFKIVSRTMYHVSLPLLICLLYFSEDLLVLLYGGEYAGGASVIILLSLGFFTNMLFGPTSDLLISAGLTRIPLLATSIGCFINIGLNIYLIPILGIKGAAIATAAGVFSANCVMAVSAYGYLRIIAFDVTYPIWTGVCVLLSPILFLLSGIPGHGQVFLRIMLASVVFLAVVYSIWYVFIFKRSDRIIEYDKSENILDRS